MLSYIFTYDFTWRGTWILDKNNDISYLCCPIIIETKRYTMASVLWTNRICHQNYICLQKGNTKGFTSNSNEKNSPTCVYQPQTFKLEDVTTDTHLPNSCATKCIYNNICFYLSCYICLINIIKHVWPVIYNKILLQMHFTAHEPGKYMSAVTSSNMKVCDLSNTTPR